MDTRIVYLRYLGNFHYILETEAGIPLTSPVIYDSLLLAKEWAECWTTSFLNRPKVGIR